MNGIDVQTTCHFNDGVECAGNDRLRCRTCGWFPPEAERRRAIGRKEFEERARAEATRRKPVVEGANENEGNLDPSRIGEYAGKWIDLNSEN